MLTRTIVLFSFGVAAILFGVSQTEAQPGKGKGPGAGADVQKLERDLERLLDQVQATKAQLARAKETTGGKKGGFEGKGRGKGGPDAKGKKDFEKGKGKGGFEKGKGKGADFKKKLEPMKQFGKGPGGKGFEGKKLDPDTIRQRYEFYKKLYDEVPKSKGFERKGPGGPKGFGPKGFEDKGPGGPKGPMTKGGGGSGSSVEARIDRLIRELDQLRSEVRGSKKR